MAFSIDSAPCRAMVMHKLGVFSIERAGPPAIDAQDAQRAAPPGQRRAQHGMDAFRHDFGGILQAWIGGSLFHDNGTAAQRFLIDRAVVHHDRPLFKILLAQAVRRRDFQLRAGLVEQANGRALGFQ